ncbi:MAG: 4Fe-4S binding protein [Alphaproteobacteria bacterium]|nr:4Fe-4S binding protein [Alphaproteobacteria bacterium]
MKYKIESDKCIACGACVPGCPFGAIVAEGGKYQINSSVCSGCGICVNFCPAGAIVEDVPATKVVDITPPANPAQAA